MAQAMNHLGETFGRWTVIARLENGADRRARWLCRCQCGTERVVAIRIMRRGISQSCGCLNREINRKRKGPTAGGWKGGRIQTSSRYIVVQVPNHPGAQKNGYVPEHRLVMEKMLGRYLTAEETVHHINGVRNDNRPENLELWSYRQPKGQRVSDLLTWAKEILTMYGGAK